MTRFFVLAARIGALFRSRSLDADLDQELQSHLAMLTDDFMRRGLSPEAARRAARLAFGGPLQIKEDYRNRRGIPFVEVTMQDVRYALRTFRRRPAYALLVVLTLAIGIGATTSMFTVVHAVLLRPLPYTEPDRLVEISEVNPLKGWTHTVVAPANFADWRARNTVFTDIAGYIGIDDRGASQYQRTLSRDGDTLPLKGLAVTGNLFEVLGVKPLAGRTFTFDETFEENSRVLVLAARTWRAVFGGDTQIIGRSIVLSGRSVTVIGVMPDDFFFPNRTVQFWTPMGIRRDVLVNMRRPHWLNTVTRLKPGVSLQQAREQMDAIAAALERTYPDTNTKMGVRLEPLHQIMAAGARPAVLMLFGAVTILFLIVCTNVAGLQLGRAAGRTSEIAVRRALGAGRGRLIRQLVTEALLLSLAGGLAGFALAAATPAVLLRLAPSALPLYAAPRVDATALLFSIALVVIAPVMFGLWPALTTWGSGQINERAESASPPKTMARHVLVACEVGLAVMLVIGAALLVRSLVQLQSVNPGFDPTNAITFKVTLPSVRYPKAADQVRVFDDIERRLRELAGVDAAGGTSTLALRGYTWTGDAAVEGRSGNDYERELRHESVTPGYFRAMSIPLRDGRLLSDHDREPSAVALANEALAKKYFRGDSAVGKRIKFGRPTDDNPWMTIVGVVADNKQDGLDEPAKPEVFVHHSRNSQNPLTFVVRSRIETEAVIASARTVVQSVDRDLAITDIGSLADLLRQSTGDERFRTTLLSGFAAVALFLAALGVYGVLAYSVAQRSRELAIRLALGAQPATLFRLVVAQGLRPVVAGAIAGIAAALASAGLIQSLLFGVTPLDPATYIGSIAVLTAVALVACTIPASRAMRLDPIVMLRDGA